MHGRIARGGGAVADEDEECPAFQSRERSATPGRGSDRSNRQLSAVEHL